MQYDDDVLEGLIQAFVDVKEKPHGEILAAKLLYALPELPYPSNMEMTQRFLESPDEKAEVYSEFYSGRVGFLLDVSFEQLGNPGRVSETAQRVLFAHMRLPPNISAPPRGVNLTNAVRDRMLEFLAYGWPEIRTPFHKPLWSPPVPHFRFVASWLDHCFESCMTEYGLRKTPLPYTLIEAMLKWSLGHQISLKECPAAIRFYQEFLVAWNKDWHQKIRLPDIIDFGNRNQLQIAEFGSDAVLPEEIANRAGVTLAFHLLGASEGAKELIKQIMSSK